MAFIDIVLGLVLAFGLIGGLRNGLLVELASLLSLLAGIYIAVKFSELAKEIIQPHVAWKPETISIAAFILTFVAVVIGVSLLARLLTKMAGIAGLGIFNTIAGGIFGAVKMMLILGVFINIYAKFNPIGETESLLLQPIKKSADFIFPVLERYFDDATSEGSL